MTDFHEVQPPYAPRWLPLVLETEVNAETLRYRLRRGGPWSEVARADILAADMVTLSRWSWPYSRRLDPGSEQLLSTSGQAVRLRLRGGRVLVLGSGRAAELLGALRG
ncbi:hypothetical protein ACTQ9L_12725 [Deinococcus wulumuqiensis]